MTKYTLDYYLERAKKGWGKVIEDDKYYDDMDLEDSFICFYNYAFAHLGLPAPTVAQLMMADFISNRANHHRMLMAMRGLALSP